MDLTQRALFLSSIQSSSKKRILNRPCIQKSDPYPNPSLYSFAHNIGCPAFKKKYQIKYLLFLWLIKKINSYIKPHFLNLPTLYQIYPTTGRFKYILKKLKCPKLLITIITCRLKAYSRVLFGRYYDDT